MATSLDIATLAVTVLTGTALAVFAFLTYKLNESITRLRYSPLLEVYPIDSPETGSFDYKDFRYYGVRWQVNLVNSGDAPILVDNIGILMMETRPSKPEEEIWRSIDKLCELYDEEGNILSGRALGINGGSQRKITILMCHKDRILEEYQMLKTGDRTVLRVELLQRGIRGRPTGWLTGRSNRFQLPKEFSKEPIGRMFI